MKSLSIATALCGLFAAAPLSGQTTYTFDLSTTSSEQGYAVSAMGSFTLTADGLLSGWVRNTSAENSVLTGFWFLDPSVNGSTLDWSGDASVPSGWFAEDAMWNNLKGELNGTSAKADDYFGAGVKSTKGKKGGMNMDAALANGETATFSFQLSSTTTTVIDNWSNPNDNLFGVALRWQSIGKKDDSAKLLGDWLDDSNVVVVPEPSAIAAIALIGLGLICARRRFAQRRVNASK